MVDENKAKKDDVPVRPTEEMEETLDSEGLSNYEQANKTEATTPGSNELSEYGEAIKDILSMVDGETVKLAEERMKKRLERDKQQPELPFRET